jgi:anti-anti-sigma factor
MTTRALTCTLGIANAHAVRITVCGDLDYDTSQSLLDLVTTVLADNPDRRVHLDCAELGFCDSYGLAMLLMVHRRVTAAGTTLHLDNRTGGLNRLLELTGTLLTLVGSADADVRRQSDR